MRKDVKFGLTVGAILIATLTVYVIVLMAGGSGSSSHPTDEQIALKPTGDSTPAPRPTDPNGPSTPGAGAPSVPNKPDTDGGGTTPPPTDPAPTTQPTAGSNADWNSMLNGGTPKLTDGQPQHTVTPSIDHPDVAIRTPEMTPTAQNHPALIDVPSLSAATPSNDPAPTADPSTRPTEFAGGAPTISDPSPQRTERTHRIASGESIWSIAESVYGNGKYYDKILKANPGVDPKHLKVGKTLVIPELGEAERSTPMVRRAADITGPLNTATEYPVVSGDTLERISIKLYGDSKMVDKLYEANKTLIGADENKLTIGWVLKLPTPPTVAAAR